MFERFTDRARRVVVFAREEARLLKHNYIGTEHILLGLIHEGEGVAARALKSLDIHLESVRKQVTEIIGPGAEEPSGHIPFTPRARKTLELSLRESFQLGHNYIGTEHILLGLIREGDGVAAQVLRKLSADLHTVRQEVIKLLSGVEGERPAAGTWQERRRSSVTYAPPTQLSGEFTGILHAGSQALIAGTVLAVLAVLAAGEWLAGSAGGLFTASIWAAVAGVTLLLVRTLLIRAESRVAIGFDAALVLALGAAAVMSLIGAL